MLAENIAAGEEPHRSGLCDVSLINLILAVQLWQGNAGGVRFGPSMLGPVQSHDEGSASRGIIVSGEEKARNNSAIPVLSSQ